VPAGALGLLALIAVPPPLCGGKIFAGYDPSQDQTPTPRAVAEIRAAYEALCPDAKTNGCGGGEIYQNPTVGNNALTWVSGIRDGRNTKAKIVYSPDFLNGLDAKFGAGASFGVLAHEVGHVMTAALAYRNRFDTSWSEELRADYLAGCALGRSGRTPGELDSALHALASVSTPTHPAFTQRSPAVHQGYDACRKVQHELDQKSAAGSGGFGIGAALKESEGKSSCWTYFYRLKEEVDRLGPVAAKRRRANLYATEKACRDAREHALAERLVSEPCACLGAE
jgi:hypothetical protein